MARIALRDHARHERLDAARDALDVEVDHPVELRLGRFPGQAGNECSRVVDQQVDLAEVRNRCGGKRLDIGALGDVGTNGQHVAAHGRKRRAGTFEGIRPYVGDRDSHAAPHRLLRQGKADPAGCAGDGGD